MRSGPPKKIGSPIKIGEPTNTAPANRYSPTECRHMLNARFTLIPTDGNNVSCILCGTTWSPDQ